VKQTKRYLVDSDILIDGLRKKQTAADYLDSLGDWSYSIASAMELFAGARNKQEIQTIEKSLAPYERIGLSADIGERGLELLRKHAKSDGTGTMDALIAATALSQGMTLSTKNDKHFRNIDGLSLETPEY
jgi:predicted nucleic acid-binding protein